MKTQPLSLFAAAVIAALSGLMPATSANAQTTCECCPLDLPASPNNYIDFSLTWAYPPSISDGFMTATVFTNGALAAGVYPSWCADAQTSLLPGTQGYDYSGSVYSSANPNLNSFLAVDTANTNALVSPAVWKEVNYLLNHRTGYNYWDVQGAIWHFVGGPAVATPPYPYFDQAAVSQLVSDTVSNAPAWCSQPGGTVAVVVALTWPADNQIIIIETPCPGTTPGLGISLSCPTDCGVAGFSGSVANTGDVTLTNVFVLSSQPSDKTLLLGPISLAPGTAAVFAGAYIIPCITNLITNMIGVITTNVVGGVTTNVVSVITTNTTGLVTTNKINVVTTNTAFVVATNTVGVVTTNTLSMVTTNMVLVVTTNTAPVVTTNTVGVVTTNTVSLVTTNTVGMVTTNTVLLVTTNTVEVVSTNTIPLVTTNTVVIVTTNTTGFVSSNAVASTFGTISPAGSLATITDRFEVGTNFHGLTYSDSDHGYAATKFYSIHHNQAANANFFDTIAPTGSTGTIADRFTLPQFNFDALAYAAPDVGYGPIIFYYLRHDAAGLSTFGSITPGGVVGVAADEKVLGSNFVALTFAATDVGYGANLFYYVRRDTNCNSIFGTIDPAQGGPVTDRFAIGADVDALVFTATDVGYGADNFYYLRHNITGRSTFGTIFVTGLTTGNVVDRFSAGTNLTELTFTATDVLYGPNLFYYLRGMQKAGCLEIAYTTNTVTTFTTNSDVSFTTNAVTSFTTNTVTSFTTNTVIGFTTNTVTSFTTNTVIGFTTNTVTSFSTNTVASFTTNTVTSFTTNAVASFTTNTVTSFTTNTVIGFTTNIVTSFSTNTVTSFTTNTVASLSTNTIISFTTNIMAAATSNTVTASGADVCQGRTVTAQATCSGVDSPAIAFVIGGAGVPRPRVGNGSFSWSFSTQTGLTYIVEYKASLTDPAWTELQTLAGSGGITTISNSMAERPAGFYRLKISP
jgi:hypothetical protein